MAHIISKQETVESLYNALLNNVPEFNRHAVFFFISATVVSKRRRFDFLSGTFYSCSVRSFSFLMASINFTYIDYAMLPGITYFVHLDFVPEKLNAKDALADRELAMTGQG
jgi:hypothetical protein